MNTIRNHPRYGKLPARELTNTLQSRLNTVKECYSADGIGAPRDRACYWDRAGVTIACDARGLRAHRGDIGATERPIRSHGTLDTDHRRLSCYYTEPGVWVTCLWSEHGALVGVGKTREESIVCAEEGRGVEVSP
jgi:hypothetical protein